MSLHYSKIYFYEKVKNINHYEERKNLSSEERVRLANERARNLAKEFEIENLFTVSHYQSATMSLSR